MSVDNQIAAPAVRRQGNKLVIGLIVLLLLGFGGFLFFLTGTYISGEEFCPQLFQKREFTYQRIPGTQIRISNTKISPATSPCSKNILTHLPSRPQTDWHVSKVQQGAFSKTLGPKILIDQLQSTDANGANIWDAWSFQNKLHAAVLWPIVQEAALQELYFCIPDILRNADSQLDIATFEKKLRFVCLQAAQSKLKALVESKESNSENKLRGWVLSFSADIADDPEFQALRSELSIP